MNPNRTELSHDPADLAGRHLETSLWLGLFLLVSSVLVGVIRG